MANVSVSLSNQDRIDAAAAAWMARMADGPLTEAEGVELSDWLAQSAAHRLALEEARFAWHLMGRVGNDDLIQTTAVAVPLRRRRVPVWVGLAASVACVMVLGWSVSCFLPGNPLVALSADYATPVATLRQVSLEDGSVVHLGPASAIAVHFNDEFRRVTLLSGEADFAVSPMNASETRPFVVDAQDGAIRALGTRFTVQHLSDSVEVAVAEHVVEVSLNRPDGERDVVQLHPGQSVRYSASGLRAVETIPVDRIADWRQGQLVFDRVALADAVAELNRYRSDRIVIADPALSARTVSGVFDSADSEAVLATIVGVLNIRTAGIPPFLTFLY